MGSGFNFDISVKADKARRNRKRGFKGTFDGSSKTCEWPDCEEAGKHRAPKSPQELDEFRWFCAAHIRDYNKSWDFYKGMSAQEIETARKSDQTWDRPTWKLDGKKPPGATDQPHAEGRAWERFGFKDAHEVLGENATINPGSAESMDQVRARRRLPKADMTALEVMGLDASATKDSIRDQYKNLVKQLHPDMNGGDRSEEERLRAVIGAWHHLKKSASFS